MELTKELTREDLPQAKESCLISELNNQSEYEDGDISQEDIFHKLEDILRQRINNGNNEALFQLGQLYFEKESYAEAKKYFEKAILHGDHQAKFQLSVIMYDNLDQADNQNAKRAFDMMLQVATSEEPEAQHLRHAALYNVGRAYYQGFGVKQNDDKAEKYFLLAADDGNPKASVKAQSTLGLFYSTGGSGGSRDLEKAFFWHSEACGNGNLESQGALGAMYLYGCGVHKDPDSAFICLKEAAERGNVYAMGHLVSYYYNRKLFTKAVEMASKVSHLENVPEIAASTDCLPGFVAKGIAMASFYYGRCLHNGLGVRKDEITAKKYYLQSYRFDGDICAHLQTLTQHGQI